MPNHVTNWVEITHESKSVMDDFKKATFVEGHINENPAENYVETSFDFNGIIQMPKILEDTVSPVQIVDTDAEAEEINNRHTGSGFPGTDQKIRAITSKESERRLKEYGANNWYDFAYNNWGTKWGAYEVELLYADDNTLVLKFQTAWSPPTPIFDKLSEDGFTINCKWQDEDPSSEGEYGDPYSVFDIDHRLEVEYTK